MIKMTLFITPQVKQRARLSRGVVYTPVKTAQFEKQVKVMARALMGTKKPFIGPLRLYARFIFKPAKKCSRTYPSKGDTSNFLKSLEDALNGVVWLDDVQVVEVNAKKIYDQSGGASRIELEVEEVAS